MKKIVVLIVLSFVIIRLHAQNCPTITVKSPYLITAGDNLGFVAEVKGASDVTYNWSISAGTITSGQGTSSITVDTKGLDGMSVTATVEIGGISSSCSTTSHQPQIFLQLLNW